MHLFKFKALLSFLLLFSLKTYATQITSTELSDLSAQWSQAVGSADIDSLKLILDENYIHIHGTGLVENKEQFIDARSSGRRRYEPIVIEEQTQRIFQNTAIVNGKFSLTAHVKDKTLQAVNRFTLVINKTKSGIKIISFQATPIP